VLLLHDVFDCRYPETAPVVLLRETIGF